MSVNRRRDRSASVREGVMRHIVGEARADARRAAKAVATVDKVLAVKPAEPRKPLKISDGALLAARQMRPVAPSTRRREATDKNPFEPYQPAPGVVPKNVKLLAMDEASPAPFNVVNAWGWGGGEGGAFSEGIGFLGYAYLAELTQRPEYRRMSERIATEMTREWIELQITSADDGVVPGVKNGIEKDPLSPPDGTAMGVPAESDAGGSTPQEVRMSVEQASSAANTKKLKELEDELTRLKIKDAFYNAAEQDGWFGRSHLFLEIGGEMAIADDAEQATSIGDGNDVISMSKVGPRKAGRGKKNGGQPLTAVRNVEPMWAYPSNYESVDPRKPGFYNPSHWYVNGRDTHGTRFLTFVGRQVPDILKPAYSFGGLSLSQMAKPYVDNWLRTRQAVADLIESFSVSGIYTNMQGTLEDGGVEAIKRIEMFNTMRSNAGAFALDKETEEFFNVSTPLGTLDALQAQSQEQMSSVSGIPLIILLGITPTGLNASSEGEIRAFYDWIHAYQESLFRDHLQTVIEFVQLSIWGEVDKQITFIFKPLWSMTKKEEAEVDKIEAETDQVRIDSGVLHPEEARKAVAAAPGSRYADINVEDVPEPPADPMEDGFDNGGDGGDDDNGGDGGFGAQDEWNESDHPRATDGKFGSGGSSKGTAATSKTPSSSKASAGAESSSMPLDVAKLKKSSGKLGSNEGGQYTDDAGGKFYIKKPSSKAHVTNEKTAAKLYELAGVNTLKYREAGPDHVATEWEQLDKNNISKFTSAERKAAAADFAVHAWLSNWDAAGLGGDNQGIRAGQPVTLDVGGSLRFRAQGGPKGAAFGDKVTELDTLRDKSMNGDAAALFGKMSDAEIKSSIERVTEIPDAKIRSVVGDDHELADRLIARKRDMAKRFGIAIAQDSDAAMMQAALATAPNSGTPAGSIDDDDDEEPEEIAPDVFTMAMDDSSFDESKHKRDKDGKFATTGAGGAGGEKEAAPAKTFSTKKEHIAHLLTEGTTPKELMQAMGWPSVSMPAQAEALKMKLEKKDGKYFGTPMSGEEWQEYLKVKAQKFKEKAAAKSPVAETLPGSPAGQVTPPKVADVPFSDGSKPSDAPNAGEPPQNYGQFLYMMGQAANNKDLATVAGLIKFGPTEWVEKFKSGASPASKAAIEKLLPGTFDKPAVPQASIDELKKAKKGTTLPISSTSPDGVTLIKAFNDKYAGKEGLSVEQLNQKVQDYKDVMAGIKKADSEYAAKSQAEKVAAAKKAQEEAQKKANEKAAKEKAELQAQFDADPELKLHYDAMEALFGGKDAGANYAAQVAGKVKNSGLSKYITPAAATPIVAYSGSHYAKLNSDIRSGVMDVAQYKFLKSLNAGLDKLPAYEGTTYRKAPSGAVDLSIYQPGKVVEERGFTSTSKNQGTWHGDVQYTVHGTSGRDIQELSSHPGEAEVLFKSGTRFLVEKVEKQDGGHHITLREI